MNAHNYIFSKQIQWAFNNNIKLTGSKGPRGRPAYTIIIEDNLFEPLLPSVIEDFNKGDGGELNGSENSPPKMHAVHSSSAIGVNIFQYWQRINQIPTIASACGLCNNSNKHPKAIKFEQKFPISSKFRYSPNIDVVIENDEKSQFKVYGIECKFSEAYGSRGHSGIDPKYLQINDIWEGVPSLHKLAKSISPDDNKYKHLHPAQLIKHCLGLKQKYGKNKFRLLYLWYDCLGEEGARHRKETEDFAEITKADGIKFHSISYQELIIKLATENREEHKKYINYISGRYL